MSGLENILGVVVIMSWLAAGGYAFASLCMDNEGLSGDQIGVLFVASLIIAPFMAAWAFVGRRRKP